MRAIILLLTLISFFSFAQSMQPKTPDDVVEQIKKHVTCDWMSKTVDVYKAGDPQTPLKGIAVCMFADMPTLEKAVELGCNFIKSEEAGMKYCAKWLKGFLAEVPIHFIENVPNFSTL
ncbi:MAG: hypothetical protein ACK5HT_06695 [Draconibacterium sp.]